MTEENPVVENQEDNSEVLADEVVESVEADDVVEDGGGVIQFLSYEGTITASGGVADGMTSADIGFSEPDSTDVGMSLQLKGTGALGPQLTEQTPGCIVVSKGACAAGENPEEAAAQLDELELAD